MKSIYENFIGLESKNLTLRFALNPEAKTQENLKLYWDKLRDEERDRAYPIVKKILDKEYQQLISEGLKLLENQNVLDWTELAEYIRTSDLSKKKKEDKRLRKLIAQNLKAHPLVDKLKVKNAFGKNGYLETLPLGKEEKEAVKVFAGFGGFFNNYNKNRENYFSTEEKSTAIANRIVNENFSKHFSNVEIVTKIQKEVPELIQIVEAQFKGYDAIFTVNGYNMALSQAGIDTYNEMVAIWNKEANLYAQKAGKLPDGHPLKKKRNYLLSALFKQIGSEKEHLIQIDRFDGDEEVIEALTGVKKMLQEADVFEKLNMLVEDMENWDYSKIYLSAQSLSNVSVFLNNLYEDERENSWNYLDNVLREKWQIELQGKKKGTDLEEAIRKKKQSFYSIEELQEAVNAIEETDKCYNVSKWLLGAMKSERVIEEKKKDVEDFCTQWKNERNSLKETDITALKEYLEQWIFLARYCKSFYANGIEKKEKDEAFYHILEDVLYVLDEVIYFYNKVRNYVTKKPYSLEKMHLKFGHNELANGWSVNKEGNYGTAILRRNGKYYLAITNSLNKKMSIPTQLESTGNNYEKMVLNVFPNVFRMIPKCTTGRNDVKSCFERKEPNEYFFIDTPEFVNPFKVTREEYELNKITYDGVKKWQSDYSKNTQDEKGYKEAVTKWIQFCMRFLQSYKSTAIYDYSTLQQPEKYETVDSFYHDVEKILYECHFEYVPANKIEQLEEEGRIFLFQIYNKDFSENRRPDSKKNLHTLYWEALFSEENRKAKVIQLNGKAEIFRREKSIEHPIVHKAGEVLVNKRTKDGEPIPDDIYKDLSNYFNGRNVTSEKEEYKECLDKVYTSTKKYDITKDKRFTETKYEFHVPITLNYQADGVKYLNQKILHVLRDNPDVNIIGLDRGERNLISYVVLNREGKIVNNQQGSFNIVGKMDYQKKLYQKENNRDKERKTWKNIETIKDLKEGYISQVVHELTDMAIRNNAIIVMEDLNFGFKRGRTKVERQVYQKFELALLKKLHYLVTDKTEGEAMLKPGGVLQGYQLAREVKTLKEIGKQCGCVFYVPPGYTSKIDPTTGFVDVFNMSGVMNREKKKAFFEKFDNMFYDEKRDMFGFSFNYEKFTTYQSSYRNDWTVYSNGSKYVWNSLKRTDELIDVTKELKLLFEKYAIDYRNEALFEQIMSQDTDKNNADFWNKLFWYFRVLLRLRNSSDELDQIVSPVLNQNGEFFETPKKITEKSYLSDYPMDADTNGAYHIALKGVYLIQEKIADESVDLDNKLPKDFYKISNAEWFMFRQKEK